MTEACAFHCQFRDIPRLMTSLGRKRRLQRLAWQSSSVTALSAILSVVCQCRRIEFSNSLKSSSPQWAMPPMNPEKIELNHCVRRWMPFCRVRRRKLQQTSKSTLWQQVGRTSTHTIASLIDWPSSTRVAEQVFTLLG